MIKAIWWTWTGTWTWTFGFDAVVLPRSPAEHADPVVEHPEAVRREVRRGVELAPFRWRVTVPQRHDLASVVPGRGDELPRQGRLVHHERVVARHEERLGEAGEHSLASVIDPAQLAVEWPRGAAHAAPEGACQALMAEADPEQGR